MISYSAALDIILRSVRSLPRTTLAPGAALGLGAAEELRSAVAVPSFDNAAMDGYALRSADTRSAAPAAPARFRVVGRIGAGEAPPESTPPGAAWEIMTGACMPRDCDAVVPLERVGESQDGAMRLIAVFEPLTSGANRRSAGEDFAPGALLLARGDPVTPQALMALAAVGCDQLAVHARPRIAVITTGSELITRGLPGAHTIRDTNGPYLEASLRALGALPGARGTVADDPAPLTAEIAAAAEESDLVITTGGVSAGRLDFVPDAVERLGGEVLLHKVAIRPGKPLLCARLKNGQLLFGLPGNPMAVAVGLRFFVVPALRAMTGLGPEHFPYARATAAIRKRASLTFFAKALTRVTPEAALEVSLLPGQESFRIAPLLRANCWAIVPEGVGDVRGGDVVRVAPLLPGEFPAGA